MILPKNYGGNGGGGVEVPVRGCKSGEECIRENQKKKKNKLKERKRVRRPKRKEMSENEWWGRGLGGACGN